MPALWPYFLQFPGNRERLAGGTAMSAPGRRHGSGEILHGCGAAPCTMHPTSGRRLTTAPNSRPRVPRCDIDAAAWAGQEFEKAASRIKQARCFRPQGSRRLASDNANQQVPYRHRHRLMLPMVDAHIHRLIVAGAHRHPIGIVCQYGPSGGSGLRRPGAEVSGNRSPPHGVPSCRNR